MTAGAENGEPQSFTSIEKAEAWLRADARETLDGTDDIQFGKMDDWGYPVAICKVAKIVKPVPVVSWKRSGASRATVRSASIPPLALRSWV